MPIRSSSIDIKPETHIASHNSLDLSEEKIRKYIELAPGMVNNPIVTADKSDIKWVEISEKKGTVIYRAEGFRCATRCSRMMDSNLDDIMSFMVMDSNETYVQRMRKIDPNFVDGAVLDTIVPRSNSKPFRYLAIKWEAIKVPGMNKIHDFVFLEYVDQGVDSLGRRVGFRVFQSVNITNLPSFIQKKCYTRGHIHHGGYLFRAETNNPNLVEARYSTHVDLAISEYFIRKQVNLYAGSLVRLSDVMERQRLTCHYFQHFEQWIPSQQRTHCQICIRAFGPFRHRKRCRICGEVVCSGCSTIRDVELIIFGKSQVRICTKCTVLSRNRDPSQSLAFGRSSSLSSLEQHELLNMRRSKRPRSDSLIDRKRGDSGASTVSTISSASEIDSLSVIQDEEIESDNLSVSSYREDSIVESAIERLNHLDLQILDNYEN